MRGTGMGSFFDDVTEVMVMLRSLVRFDPAHPLSMCLAMMSFWISLVPSKMRKALTCR
jgi:hypothetical protein